MVKKAEQLNMVKHINRKKKDGDEEPAHVMGDAFLPFLSLPLRLIIHIDRTPPHLVRI